MTCRPTPDTAFRERGKSAGGISAQISLALRLGDPADSTHRLRHDSTDACRSGSYSRRYVRKAPVPSRLACGVRLTRYTVILPYVSHTPPLYRSNGGSADEPRRRASENRAAARRKVLEIPAILGPLRPELGYELKSGGYGRCRVSHGSSCVFRWYCVTTILRPARPGLDLLPHARCAAHHRTSGRHGDDGS